MLRPERQSEFASFNRNIQNPAANSLQINIVFRPMWSQKPYSMKSYKPAYKTNTKNKPDANKNGHKNSPCV